MQIFFGVTPGEFREASRFTGSPAHLAYRIGEDSSLLRQAALPAVRGGLLALSDCAAPPVRDPEALTTAVLRECGRRGFSGVLLDFESDPRPDLEAFAARLSRRITVYLPERFAPAAPEAVPLLCTALSGGSLPQYLREKAKAYNGRLALDVQRLRMEFSLPAPTGEGMSLSADAFSRLLQEEAPAVFFSPELCARYFTCRRDGGLRFILFDDADTLRRKLRLGQALNLPAAFFLWPEVRDLAPRLFGTGS